MPGAGVQASPGSRRSRRRAARAPTRRRRGRRPSRPGRRSGRGRGSSRRSRASAAAAGVPPTAGVGWSARASSSAPGAGSRRRPVDRRREVRDVGERARPRRSARRRVARSAVEGTDDRVDDDAVLVVRPCATPSATRRRRRRRRCRPSGATPRRSRCAGRAARGSRRRGCRRRRRSTRAAARAGGRGPSAGRTGGRRRRSPPAPARPSRARRGRSPPRACSTAWRQVAGDVERGHRELRRCRYRGPRRDWAGAPISVTQPRPPARPTTRAGTTSSPGAVGSNGSAPTAIGPVPGRSSTVVVLDGDEQRGTRRRPRPGATARR